MKKPNFFLFPDRLQKLLDGFLKQATEAPAQGSLPLFIGRHRCGWLFPIAAQALSGTPGIQLNQDSVHFGENLPSGEALDAFLAEVALKLKLPGARPAGEMNYSMSGHNLMRHQMPHPKGSQPLSVA